MYTFAAPGKRPSLSGVGARASQTGMRRIKFALLLVALAGCASATPIPDQDRADLESQLAGRQRWLRVSMYRAPFWDDGALELLSPTPPPDLQLFNDAHGNPVPGPQATGIVPAGRKVTVDKVELPTGMVIAGRLPYTPRYNPWIYVSLSGEKSDKRQVIVLRSDLKSKDQFLHALDRLLSVEDPNPRLASYPDEIQKAIAEKQVVRDMDPEAVEMAWGLPDHKTIDLKGGTRTEVWTWAGKRSVQLVDGKVTKFESPAPAQPAGT